MPTGSKPAVLRSRIAPTPSGYLHLGNAFSFVLTSLITQAKEGRLLLRIDDLDQARKRQAYIDDIFFSLEWLGIPYDEGPSGPDEFEASYSQIHRLDLYEEAFKLLGDLKAIYRCKCSRKQLKNFQEQGLIPCPCKSSNSYPSEEAWAWKVDTPSDQAVSWNDLYLGEQTLIPFRHTPNFIVWKKDGLPAYQLSSLVDDSHFGVNFIVRGKDLLASTSAQLWLAQLLDKNDFLETHFLHHPLIKDPKNEKLSKSQGARSLKHLREKWGQADLLFRLFSKWLQLPESANNLEEMLPLFQSVYLPSQT